MYKLLIISTYDKLKEFPLVWSEKKGGKKITYAEYPKIAGSTAEACEIKDMLRSRGFRRVQIVTDE